MIKKSPLHPIGRKHKERIAQGLDERTTFKIKWLRNKGKTDLTWRFFPIESVQSFQFAHGLSKWYFPEYRNYVSNIVYVDNIQQHERVDKQIAWHKYVAEALMLKWELIPRLKKKWQDFLIKQRQWNIH